MPPRSGKFSHSPLDVGHVATAAIAVVICAAFYGGVVFPLYETWFGQLLANRGLVQYGVVLLGVWSLVMVIARSWRVRREARALSDEIDLLPRGLGDRISEANADIFVVHVTNAAGGSRGELSGRITRALAHLHQSGRAEDVVEHLAHEANTSHENSENGYSMVRLCIWAIPILGFIGTVAGIGDAIGAFDEKLGTVAKLEEIRGSLGAVTAGLALAFETTLLALVVSVLVMFTTGAVHRYETAFLIAVDD